MIFQFSLYGFLKNLRFFEAFLFLFLRDKGLSFTEIGLLLAFKEVLVNLFNIPTGAIADLYGRKKSLIFAFAAYVFSFLIFSYGASFALLYVAMFLFGIGESFRSGTHKAMIFDYLRKHDRLKDKTLIYGLTRSWSQKGSALSVLIGAAIVYFGAGYKNIFLYSIIPYLIGIVNIALYPSYLDMKNETGASIKEIFAHLIKTTKKCWHSVGLKHLIIQSTLYEGQYRSVKDYLQILVGLAATTLPFFLTLAAEKKTAVLIGIIYFILYYLSSYASKYSHKVLLFCKTEERAIRMIMLVTAILLTLSAICVYVSILWPAIICFILIFNLQNVMRPIMTARYDDLSSSDEQATILSIESQANSVGIFILAPILGFLADNYNVGYAFLLCSVILFLYIFLSTKKKIEAKS